MTQFVRCGKALAFASGLTIDGDDCPVSITRNPSSAAFERFVNDSGFTILRDRLDFELFGSSYPNSLRSSSGSVKMGALIAYSVSFDSGSSPSASSSSMRPGRSPSGRLSKSRNLAVRA